VRLREERLAGDTHQKRIGAQLNFDLSRKGKKSFGAGQMEEKCEGERRGKEKQGRPRKLGKGVLVSIT